LISGGGSALLPAPIEGITVADKQAVTRHLSGAGATINELNTVRKQLSRIKGGGLARACKAGRLISLIVSDVTGDPLDVIASGPTVPDPSSPRDALRTLERFGAREAGIPDRVFQRLEEQAANPETGDACNATNLIIGTNRRAVEAAGAEATRLGYSPGIESAETPEGQAEDVGRELAQAARTMRTEPGPDCMISGGEPVVTLAPEADRGMGGRNQQLVLAALDELGSRGFEGVALLSGGTDGEDGPTDAAGAFCDRALAEAASEHGLDPADFLRRNDAYHFFEPLGGLIKTGPTHTNVMDLRVVLVDRMQR
ncbi:MAG: DUF4147 domain-containing protein, partial [Planctomycetales bacterium]